MKTLSRHPADRGFTLVELLVTISIVAILAASAYGAYGLLIAKFRKSEAQVYAKGIERAVTDYQGEYGDKYPVGDVGGGEGDVEVQTEKGSETVKILFGGDIEKNAKSINFLEGMKQAKVNDQGVYKGGLIIEEESYGVADPWGGYYTIKMDADYDKSMDNPDIENAKGRLKLHGKVLVWCGGEDKNDQTWNDNVKSWE